MYKYCSNPQALLTPDHMFIEYPVIVEIWDIINKERRDHFVLVTTVNIKLIAVFCSNYIFITTISFIEYFFQLAQLLNPRTAFGPPVKRKRAVRSTTHPRSPQLLKAPPAPGVLVTSEASRSTTQRRYCFDLYKQDTL